MSVEGAVQFVSDCGKQVRNANLLMAVVRASPSRQPLPSRAVKGEQIECYSYTVADRAESACICDSDSADESGL